MLWEEVYVETRASSPLPQAYDVQSSHAEDRSTVAWLRVRLAYVPSASPS